MKLYTYILCTFSFLQIFNYINCRKIGPYEVNVFENMLNKWNHYFWGVVIFVTLLQITMVQFFFYLTRTTPLNMSEWGACIMTGATVIPVSAMLKMTGTSILKKIPFSKFIDENKEENDRIVNKIRALSNEQVNVKKGMFKK